MSLSNEVLLKFPQDFPIKIIGKVNWQFQQVIVKIIQEFDSEFDDSRVQSRFSKKSNYICLTVTVHITSRVQLDDLYCVLTGHPMVKIVL
ncbi:DUF493 family protein [Candidatus Vallotia cooleyia]|uniref:DUF493 family protein n=1 Tax=Candidatus Vallotiella adelgis TaxID=1177211 RepID=UPI001D01D3F8|nr:DUF493 family protein [Candidatus Vallotia cooleyia]